MQRISINSPATPRLAFCPTTYSHIFKAKSRGNYLQYTILTTKLMHPLKSSIATRDPWGSFPSATDYSARVMFVRPIWQNLLITNHFSWAPLITRLPDVFRQSRTTRKSSAILILNWFLWAFIHRESQDKARAKPRDKYINACFDANRFWTVYELSSLLHIACINP